MGPVVVEEQDEGDQSRNSREGQVQSKSWEEVVDTDVLFVVEVQMVVHSFVAGVQGNFVEERNFDYCKKRKIGFDLLGNHYFPLIPRV